MAGRAEQLQHHGIFGVPTLPLQAQAQQHPQAAIHPDQRDEGEAIHGLARLTGKDPGAALDRCGQRLGTHRVTEDEISLIPDREGVKGMLKECMPPPKCLATFFSSGMGDGFQRFG